VSQRNTTRQQGAALVVGMIMLVLITLMLVTALNLGTTNFRAMTNMQFRSEAIAAANQAIEQVISSPFTAAPAAETINVDIDNDTDTDYVVQIAEPQCVFAAQAFGADPSSLSLPVSMSVASTWNTVWDVDASVDGDDPTNVSGTDVRVRAGVRVLLTEAEKNVVCP
jgi:Tfp pilus assembly protein PilX